MNSRGVELAASFIIILIISIIMLGLAGGITYKLMCSADNKIEELDDSSEKFIEAKLNSGAKVQVPVAVKAAKTGAGFCGEKGRAGVSFSMGIRNDDAREHTFRLDTEYKGVFEGDELVSATGPNWDIQSRLSQGLIIQGKDKGVAQVLFNVPAGTQKGKHMFTLRVKDENGQFYGAANVYIEVQ